MSEYTLENVTEFERIELLEENLGAFRYGPGHVTKFYVFFVCMDENNEYITFELEDILTEVENGNIKLINYLTGDEYTLGYADPDPDDNDFLASNFFIKNDNINVLEIKSNKFTGFVTISALFKYGEDKIVSTDFMALSGFDSRAILSQSTVE